MNIKIATLVGHDDDHPSTISQRIVMESGIQYDKTDGDKRNRESEKNIIDPSKKKNKREDWLPHAPNRLRLFMHLMLHERVTV